MINNCYINNNGFICFKLDNSISYVFDQIHLQPKTWYFINISHDQITSTEYHITLYINSKLIQTKVIIKDDVNKFFSGGGHLSLSIGGVLKEPGVLKEQQFSEQQLQQQMYLKDISLTRELLEDHEIVEMFHSSNYVYKHDHHYANILNINQRKNIHENTSNIADQLIELSNIELDKFIFLYDTTSSWSLESSLGSLGSTLQQQEGEAAFLNMEQMLQTRCYFIESSDLFPNNQNPNTTFPKAYCINTQLDDFFNHYQLQKLEQEVYGPDHHQPKHRLRLENKQLVANIIHQNFAINVMGIPLVFYFINKAETNQQLVQALELLYQNIYNDVTNLYQMIEIHGYKLLANILYKKRTLIQVNVLNSLFKLTEEINYKYIILNGYLDLYKVNYQIKVVKKGLLKEQEQVKGVAQPNTTPHNMFVIKYILMYINLWKDCSKEIQHVLYQKLTTTYFKKKNQQLNILQWLIDMLSVSDIFDHFVEHYALTILKKVDFADKKSIELISSFLMIGLGKINKDQKNDQNIKQGFFKKKKKK